MPEDSKRSGKEMIQLGVSENELGAEHNVGIERGAKKVSMEMA